MSEVNASDQWSKSAVVSRLKDKLRQGHPVSVQVFLNQDCGDVSGLAQTMVDDSLAQAGMAPQSASLGRIFRLANSFSVSSDNLPFFESLSRRPEVKSLIESEQSDIFPKPVAR
ncbi:hypothetical protein [Asticcacaulis benevestitus]|uniref:Uncharacterized protein n=1 Tax=Asticcacaulis benevestitus DSM 16100 = ATCC BAA-896 TaxID=1121022 RepID=V4PEJ8_9CAUL|nr:hypothetical protein [Asticcacaulis benevestitus]ESQ83760.1 hypothetical protein ABENE_20015 [Asticcacaulis benevestitus DSM 16100 = ATCC BAA-896]